MKVKRYVLMKFVHGGQEFPLLSSSIHKNVMFAQQTLQMEYSTYAKRWGVKDELDPEAMKAFLMNGNDPDEQEMVWWQIQEVETELTSNDLCTAYRELEISSIEDDIIARWDNYEPQFDHEVRSCAEDIYADLQDDDYVAEIRDNRLCELIDTTMENRGLV